MNTNQEELEHQGTITNWLAWVNKEDKYEYWDITRIQTRKL